MEVSGEQWDGWGCGYFPPKNVSPSVNDRCAKKKIRMHGIVMRRAMRELAHGDDEPGTLVPAPVIARDSA